MSNSSALIVASEREGIYLIFKLAYKFALKGMKCLIITKSIPDGSFKEIINERSSFSPDLLEMIQFRHFSSAKSLIDWCHCFQIGQTMPHAVFLSGFENFCDISDFSAYYLCACLQDISEFFAKSLSHKNIHNFQLLVAFNSCTYDNRPAFFDLFRTISSSEEVENKFRLTDLNL